MRDDYNQTLRVCIVGASRQPARTASVLSLCDLTTGKRAPLDYMLIPLVQSFGRAAREG